MVTASDASRVQLASQVRRAVFECPVVDIHTHLYDPAFGSLLLWGIDDLLVYHYLVAETFRFQELPYDAFFQLSKEEQADRVWQTLFIDHSPLSEAARGVITTLHRLGIDPRPRDLPVLRRWFAEWKVEDYLTRCLELARVKAVCMTNSPFDDTERAVWEEGFSRDPRFMAALRIDPLLLSWLNTAPQLQQWGYLNGTGLNQKAFDGARRFLNDWAARIAAKYVMVSLPPSFRYPDDGEPATLIDKVVLPFCRETGLPFALMLGVKRAVNPALRLAGDGVGRSDLAALENLCAAHPEVRFLVTVLSRENQHELCVMARKFRNLHIFGCWWFTNIPLLLGEITRLRLELLGPSFTPQHSDARVLDQVIYKWEHSRHHIAEALTAKYLDLADAGWRPSEAEVRRDVNELFGGAFEAFCGHTRLVP
jgi:hypothetical protein